MATPPSLTKEERAAALEKAKVARKKRAAVLDDLEAGKITVKDVLAMKNDEIMGRTKVCTMIQKLPGYGEAKTKKIMNEIGIAESRRLRGLGERQQAELLERLG